MKNISQLGLFFPIYGKIKNVPNHQPVYIDIHIQSHTFGQPCQSQMSSTNTGSIEMTRHVGIWNQAILEGSERGSRLKMTLIGWFLSLYSWSGHWSTPNARFELPGAWTMTMIHRFFNWNEALPIILAGHEAILDLLVYPPVIKRGKGKWPIYRWFSQL